MDSLADHPLGEESPSFFPAATDMNQLDFQSVPNEQEEDGYLSGSLYDESDDENAQPSLKRPAEDSPVPRAFKRNKGVLNLDYLDLLNVDIEDAAQRVTVAGETDLEPDQHGVSFWSSTEKKLFFEATARLGRDDLPGIAAMIGTKSEIEVNHYLSILRRAQLLRQREGLRPAMEFPEHPAAVELSQQLCHALDEAADAISVRQEHKEEQREEGKWGGHWNISPQTVQALDKAEGGAEGLGLHFAGLFHLRNWLGLSERIFMNSSIPSDNWHFIDSHPPAVWATTFEDFHSLTVSITRRLVQTTLFLAMSRIRSRRELDPATRDVIKRQDVEAAVASLGLSPDSDQFWLRCARRLRLEVYEEPPSYDEEGEHEALTYEKVEDALRTTKEEDEQPSIKRETSEPLVEDGLDEHHFKEEEVLDDKVPDTSESEADDVPSSPSSADGDDDDEEAAVTHEANEVLQFSAADFPKTHRTMQSLRGRVAAERRQEAYAEERDQHASWQAEAELWDLLQRKPPMELPRMREPGPLQRSKLDTESLFPIGRDWRSNTRYHAEWEVEEASDTPEEG